MKINFLLLVTFFLIISCGNETSNSNKNIILNNIEGSAKLRHVVLFTFKESSTSIDIKKIEEAFNELPSKIPEIKDFEWGINNSPEKINKGFTHCFILTFQSEKDRDIYLPHPDHLAFGKLLNPYLEDVLVIDYWAK